MEYLSSAPLSGKLLTFPTDIKLGCYCFLWTNTLAYLASPSVTMDKSFITLTSGHSAQSLLERGHDDPCSAALRHPGANVNNLVFLRR